MAAALEVGGAGTVAVAWRPLLGGIVCSLPHAGASPLTVKGLHLPCSGWAVLPTCRGLKLNYGRRFRAPRFYAVRRSPGHTSIGIVCESPETAVGGTGVVSDQTFQKLVLESDVPVLVDFWAPWCGPCRMIAPIIDELARQYAGKIRCLKLNTDESPYIATEYGIRSIPTVMIFKRGEKKDTVIGAVPKSTLTATIEKYLEW